MRIALPINVYTQINTNDTDYLIQNINGGESVKIIISPTQQVSNADFDFILEPYSGIGSFHINGLVCGKPFDKTSFSVGIVEA